MGDQNAVMVPPRPLWPPDECRRMGRCEVCGHHLVKQGHHESCPRRRKVR